ncbi:MAG: 30S ribosomal protein S16 [Candidatus Anoxychlamydiales bacterium]|nr:30S ribosomal protein S16 [Candidatus Anoxychlamydiales bacterium]
MALTIRLRKMGRTNSSTFRLVVLDKRAPRDGKYIEMLGWYKPLEANDKNLSIKSDRVEHYLNLGAEISIKAKNLVKKAAPEIIKKLNEKKVLKNIKLKQKAKSKAKK